VELPIRLVMRAAAPAAADGFLVFGDDPAPLAAACARFGGPWPDVFVVRGGFLLVPRAADARAVPGAVRLRRLGGDLYVPLDADLLPALLPDEVAALTRARGLVVLPGGTAAAFDPAARLPVARVLAPARVRRDDWEPFPRRADRPDALGVIERPAPPVAAVLDVLGSGAPDDARPLPGAGETAAGPVPEDARPPAGSLAERAAASVGYAAGGLLAWLGRQLGAAGLARLGGNLARRALEAVPRLSERLLGEQEAALRDVLRELQTGDVEKGLRRAPPAVADPDRPAQIGTNARLTPRDPRYSLRDLVSGGGGVGSVWLGGGDVWAALGREYRRLAAEAGARGDHRRAAYLYGVLLRDLRAAANALLAGGLYRDAALLFRDRLNDPLAAAEAFDRAGDHDEALRLYDHAEQYERAGDLLRRLGEDARANTYYVRAAERLAAGKRYVAAGDLLLKKAFLRSPAADFYRRGWRAGCAEDVTCAERLADEYAAAENRAGLVELWAEAEAALEDRPRDAGRFFNYVLRTGAFLPAEVRADLSDRARLVFAGHLRGRVPVGEAAALVETLFPTHRPWAPPVVRDAAFVARNRRKGQAAGTRPVEPPVRLTRETVTAVAVARGTFDLVVAAADGVFLWRVADGRVVPVCPAEERLRGLTVSERAEVVGAVVSDPDWSSRLAAFADNGAGGYRRTAVCVLPGDQGEGADVYLSPAATTRNGHVRITAVAAGERVTFGGPYLSPVATEPFPEGGPVHLLVETADGYEWQWAGPAVRCRGPGADPNAHGWHVSWVPAGGPDWLAPEAGVLEVAAVDVGGNLRWARYDGRDPSRSGWSGGFAEHPKGYATACLVAPGVVAAATTGNEVRWLRAAGTKLTVTASVAVREPGRIVRLAARPDPHELAAVLADGLGLRVRRPQ
jgi:tetratricopeptide (TPR) repeat protein